MLGWQPRCRGFKSRPVQLTMKEVTFEQVLTEFGIIQQALLMMKDWFKKTL